MLIMKKRKNIYKFKDNHSKSGCQGSFVKISHPKNQLNV
jgi:hypothetical protein